MFTGKELRAKRESLRLSAAKLATILKTTKENIYKWEGGTKPSKHEDMINIENWMNGVPEIVKDIPRASNGIDWQKKYYDLLEKYTAVLEKMK